MAVIAAQKVGKGLSPVFAAAASTDQYPTGQGLYLLVRNAHTAPTNVELDVPVNQWSGAAYADYVQTVAANTGFAVIPLNDIYRDPVSGYAEVNYTVENAAITRAVVAL